MFVKVNDTWLEYTEISYEDKPSSLWDDFNLVSVADKGEILYKNYCTYPIIPIPENNSYKIKSYPPLNY